MTEKTSSERQFEEAIRRASQRYRKRRAGIDAVWRRANKSPSYAHRAVLTLAAKAHHEPQQGRRNLYAQFGVDAPSNENNTVLAYPIVRPERSRCLHGAPGRQPRQNLPLLPVPRRQAVQRRGWPALPAVR